MATTGKILYSIFEQCTGKIPSDDYRLKELFILHLMNSARAILIAEDMKSGRNLAESYYQMKCCLELECDDIICGSIGSGQSVYFVRLPKLIDGIGWRNITYFGTVEFPKYRKGLSANFDRYNLKGFLGLEFQEWAGKRPAYVIQGGYKDGDTTIDGNLAFVKNPTTRGLKYVCVNGIWAEPEQSICDKEDYLEMEYPLPEIYVYRLELIVIKQLLSTEPVPGDPIQDGRDNTGTQSMPNNVARNLAQQQDFKESE